MENMVFGVIGKTYLLHPLLIVHGSSDIKVVRKLDLTQGLKAFLIQFTINHITTNQNTIHFFGFWGSWI